MGMRRYLSLLGLTVWLLPATAQAYVAHTVAPGETLWQARLGTSVQGYPVAFSVGGRQYVAVTTGGSGGGSPRQVPRTIIPEVKMPATGNALYVFALPEKAR